MKCTGVCAPFKVMFLLFFLPHLEFSSKSMSSLLTPFLACLVVIKTPNSLVLLPSPESCAERPLGGIKSSSCKGPAEGLLAPPLSTSAELKPETRLKMLLQTFFMRPSSWESCLFSWRNLLFSSSRCIEPLLASAVAEVAECTGGGDPPEDIVSSSLEFIGDASASASSAAGVCENFFRRRISLRSLCSPRRKFSFMNSHLSETFRNPYEEVTKVTLIRQQRFVDIN